MDRQARYTPNNVCWLTVLSKVHQFSIYMFKCKCDMQSESEQKDTLHIAPDCDILSTMYSKEVPYQMSLQWNKSFLAVWKNDTQTDTVYPNIMILNIPCVEVGL